MTSQLAEPITFKQRARAVANINFQCDRELVDRMDRAAESLNTPRSEFIRKAVESLLNKLAPTEA